MPFPPNFIKHLMPYNDQRKIAHQIILDLFKAKEREQLVLLQQACHLSLRELEPHANIDRIKEELEVLYKKTKSGPDYDDVE